MLNGFIGALHHAGRRLDFTTLRAKAMLAYGADRRWRRDAKFQRLAIQDTVELDGEEVEIGRIVWYAEEEKPEPGIPFDTLTRWVAEGRL